MGFNSNQAVARRSVVLNQGRIEEIDVHIQLLNERKARLVKENDELIEDLQKEAVMSHFK